MVYQNKVVAAIKVGGKVLRESDGLVTLPFGAEYSILVKNLNAVRIQAKISIDGSEATGERWLIINPNGEMELERFIRNDNLSTGNRFKFIERTKEIEEHRGIKSDDGIVRIEYKVESVPIHVPRIHYDDYWVPTPRWPRDRRGRRRWNDGYVRASGATNLGGMRSLTTGSIQASAGSRTTMNCSVNTSNVVVPTSDVGITVEGSQSNQQFQNVWGFLIEPQSHVLVLRLRGEIGGQPVTHPVTVDTKKQCKTCGRSGKGKFCDNCGTSLELF